MNDISSLVERYQGWLRDRTILREVKDWTEITTPYLDRHNDYVQIYVRRDAAGYILTDDGHTLSDLAASGVAMDSRKRQQLLKLNLAGFGVEIRDDELFVHATDETFPLRKHSLIQAILAVNDLFVLASSTVRGIFIEDVTSWLDLKDIRYVPRVNLVGSTRFSHLFDFAVPKSKTSPERLIRAIGNPTRDKAESFAFAWLDTKEVRPPDTIAVAIVNDNERRISSSVVEALQAYKIQTIPWSERESALNLIAA